MNKLVLLSIAVTSFMYASVYGEANHSTNQTNKEKYSWIADTTDDNFIVEGRRRGGKRERGRRRGGGGLR